MRRRPPLEIIAMVLVGIGTLFALAVALGPYLVLYLMTHPDLPTPGGH